MESVASVALHLMSMVVVESDQQQSNHLICTLYYLVVFLVKINRLLSKRIFELSSLLNCHRGWRPVMPKASNNSRFTREISAADLQQYTCRLDSIVRNESPE
ncbi:hypothetical protein PVAND_014258 [Polypedilum vanderplanki]|uniref:Uncharacterized protein n=1 Tax=Polypedilum vanderplanki TaxID=319348 RepID=A0A9J6CSV6_POLVA|nr:hypothetical protein PVAND_014258 [Polypedilum vanderplanki]